MDSLSTQSGLQVRHRQLHSRWFAAASASSLLDTSPHLGRQQLFLCYRLHPETPHTHPPPPCPTRATTAAVPVRRAAAPTRTCRIIPTQYAVSAPLLARDRATQPTAQPAASAHIANLSVPSATCRGCVLLCARIPRSPFPHWAITRRAWRWLVQSV